MGDIDNYFYGKLESKENKIDILNRATLIISYPDKANNELLTKINNAIEYIATALFEEYCKNINNKN